MKTSNYLSIAFFTILLIGVIIQVKFYVSAKSSPQWQYAERAIWCPAPSYDLRYCVDLSDADRKDFTYTSWKPLPCINTATSFYNEYHRAGNCNRFMANPAKWHFVEVAETDAVPGDLMLFIRKKDGARHAGVYTMNSLLGPLCANSSYPQGSFRHFMPVKPLLYLRVDGFYQVKYYRYNPD